MKLEFNKNFERNLVKLHGFKIDESYSSTHFTVYRLRNLALFLRLPDNSVFVKYKSDPIHIPINGCKTMHDLYRLELLIEGKKTNQNG